MPRRNNGGMAGVPGFPVANAVSKGGSRVWGGNEWFPDANEVSAGGPRGGGGTPRKRTVRTNKILRTVFRSCVCAST